MNRIQNKFSECKKEGKVAFMPFMIAGDPDYETSKEIARIMLPYADFLEIGFPYSDPLADGPTIQAGNERALKAGITTDKVFSLIRDIRGMSDVPITILVYSNLVYQRGITKFYRDAKKAGIDAVLIPDVPIEEARPYLQAAKSVGITPIFLVTQTTHPKRLKRITSVAKGYLYLVSILGVTGQRQMLEQKTTAWVKRIKRVASLPVAVGFGISKPEHVVSLKQAGVDGVIVGSAIVNIIEQHLHSHDRLQKALSRYLQLLVQAL